MAAAYFNFWSSSQLPPVSGTVWLCIQRIPLVWVFAKQLVSDKRLQTKTSANSVPICMLLSVYIQHAVHDWEAINQQSFIEYEATYRISHPSGSRYELQNQGKFMPISYLDFLHVLPQQKYWNIPSLCSYYNIKSLYHMHKTMVCLAFFIITEQNAFILFTGSGDNS